MAHTPYRQRAAAAAIQAVALVTPPASQQPGQTQPVREAAPVTPAVTVKPVHVDQHMRRKPARKAVREITRKPASKAQKKKR